MNKLEKLEEKIRKDINDKEFISRFSSFKEEIETIKLVWSQIETIKSNNLKMFILSCFHTDYLDHIHNVYNHIDSYLNNQIVSTPLKSAKNKYINLAESYNNLTGIPIKSFIDFKLNWDLIESDSLYNFITGEENQEDDKFKATDKHLILMNRRQRMGADTPRRKYNLCGVKNVTINNYTIESENINNSSYSRMDTNRSIDFREEEKFKHYVEK